MNTSNKVTSNWGVGSLILSIIGLLLIFMPYFGILFSIGAIGFAIKQRRIQHTGYDNAGMIIGIIGVVLNAIMLAIVIGFLTIFGMLFSSSNQQPDNISNNSDISLLTQEIADTQDQLVEGLLGENKGANLIVLSATGTFDSLTNSLRLNGVVLNNGTVKSKQLSEINSGCYKDSNVVSTDAGYLDSGLNPKEKGFFEILIQGVTSVDYCEVKTSTGNIYQVTKFAKDKTSEKVEEYNKQLQDYQKQLENMQEQMKDYTE